MAGTRKDVIEYQLRLKDLATKALKKFGATVQTQTTKAQAAFRRLGKSVKKFGLGLKVAMAATVFMGLRTGIRRLREFSKAMGEVRTIMDETSMSFEDAERRVKKMGASMGVASPEVAAGLYQTLSAGVTDSAQAFMLLEKATGLGIAGVATTKEAVDLLTTSFNAYGKTVTEQGVEKMSDMIFKTVQLGKTTIPELAASMGQVLPMASQLGMSFEEAAAAVATLTLSGLSTSEAVTQVSAVMTAFLKKGELARKEFPELGNVMGASAIRSKGFMQAMKDLTEATGGSEEMLVKLTGRVEGAKAIMLLTGAGEQKFTEALEGIGSAAGVADEALNKMLDTTDRRMSILTEGWKDAWASFMEGALSVGKDATLEDVQMAADDLREAGEYIGGKTGAVIRGATIAYTKSSQLMENHGLRMKVEWERLRGASKDATLAGLDLIGRHITATEAKLRGVSNAVITEYSEALEAQIAYYDRIERRQRAVVGGTGVTHLTAKLPDMKKELAGIQLVLDQTPVEIRVRLREERKDREKIIDHAMDLDRDLKAIARRTFAQGMNVMGGSRAAHELGEPVDMPPMVLGMEAWMEQVLVAREALELAQERLADAMAGGVAEEIEKAQQVLNARLKDMELMEKETIEEMFPDPRDFEPAMERLSAIYAGLQARIDEMADLGYEGGDELHDARGIGGKFKRRDYLAPGQPLLPDQDVRIDFRADLEKNLGFVIQFFERYKQVRLAAYMEEEADAQYQVDLLADIRKGAEVIEAMKVEGQDETAAAEFQERVKLMQHGIDLVAMGWEKGYDKEVELINRNSELDQEKAREKAHQALIAFKNEQDAIRENLEAKMVAEGMMKEAREKVLVKFDEDQATMRGKFTADNDKRREEYIAARKTEAEEGLRIAKENLDDRIEEERKGANKVVDLWVAAGERVAKAMARTAGQIAKTVSENVQKLIEDLPGLSLIDQNQTQTAVAQLAQFKAALKGAKDELVELRNADEVFAGSLEEAELEAAILNFETYALANARAAEQIELHGVAARDLVGLMGTDLVAALGSAGTSLQFLSSQDVQPASEALANFKAQVEGAQAEIAKMEGMGFIDKDQADEMRLMVERVKELKLKTLEAAAAAEKLKESWAENGATWENIKGSFGAGVKEWGESLGTVGEQVQELGKKFAIGLHGAIMDFISGAKTAKEAWKDFSKAFLLEIASMIVKQMLMNTLLAIGRAIGFLFAEGGIAPGGLSNLTPLASGGVVAGGLGRVVPVKGYATGGPIVSQPHVALVGEGGMNEAVVPLPDGKSIPVQMEGGGGGAAVSISIQAIDAKGIDELLFQKQDLLAGLMQRALQEDRAFRGAFRGR